MPVKFHPRSPFQFRVRAHFVSLTLFGALAAACAPEEEMEGPPITTQPMPIVEAGVDTGVVAPPPGFDAGPIGFVPDATVSRPDTGVMVGPFDTGVMMPPLVDAGSDAGRQDSGTTGDAGASGDAGGCPTYDNFGRMFLMTYCVSCHMGAAAPKMVRLDTLAGVMAQKSMIQRVAVTGTAMPPSNPRPSAADRQKLGQWLTCGPM
jgi:hypothetical protein